MRATSIPYHVYKGRDEKACDQGNFVPKIGGVGNCPGRVSPGGRPCVHPHSEKPGVFRMSWAMPLSPHRFQCGVEGAAHAPREIVLSLAIAPDRGDRFFHRRP